MYFSLQRRAIFHFSCKQLPAHLPLYRAYFSTQPAHKSLKNHSDSRLSWFSLLGKIQLSCDQFEMTWFYAQVKWGMKLETLLLGLLFRAAEVGLRSPLVPSAIPVPPDPSAGLTCNCSCTCQVAIPVSSHWELLLGIGVGSAVVGGAGIVRGRQAQVPIFNDSPRRRGGGYIHIEGS